MSGIGLSGSHGCGKTTLALAYCKEFEMVFLPSNASQVILAAGRNPGEDLEFSDRLHLQELVLASAIESYESVKGSAFITDRTPLDFLTYLLTDVRRNNVEGELAERLLDYKRRCFNAVNNHFNVIVVVQPGIEVVDREGKGSANEAYAEHYNAIISGLSVSSDLLVQATFVPRACLDIETRVNAVSQSVTVAFNAFERMSVKKGAKILSKGIH